MHIIGFQPIYDENSKVLIVGTHPSPDGYKKGMFYSSKFNSFWRILDSVLNTNFCESINKLVPDADNSEIINEIKQKLYTNKIAICDAIKECDGGGTDTQIKNEILRDKSEIKTIIENSKIETILCTSGDAKKYFIRIFNDNKNAITKNAIQSLQEYMGNLKIEEPIIEKLLSPSPMLKRCGITDEQRQAQWKKLFTKALNKNNR